MTVIRHTAKGQERFALDNTTVAAVSATGSIVLGKIDFDYALDWFEVEVPGGYTADDTNRYTLTLQVGATVKATIDLKTAGAGGSGNLTDLVIFRVAPSAVLGTAGDTLKVVMTKNGTAANLAAGTLFFAKGRLL